MMAEVEVTAGMIKQLRERTGVGMGKCKEALVEARGDMELAIANLRKAGIASAVKKEGREAKEGMIVTGANDSTVALVEVNVETDFVVKNDKFQSFTKALVEEICHTSPANLEDFLKQKFSKDSKLSIDEFRAVTVQSLGENIQIKRLEIFPKKADHSIGIYSHMGGKLVTLVEISGSKDEVELAKDIAMHIAAEAPEYLSSDEIPERVIEHEKEIAQAQIQNKPPQIQDKIIEGKLKSYFNQACLLNQHFIKDTSITVDELVKKRSKESGKELKLVQFLRWKIGE